MAFQLSDDIMDIISTQMELGKEPGSGHAGGRVHAPGPARPARGAAPGGAARLLAARAARRRALDRALEIVRSDGSIGHARQAVTAEVARATGARRAAPDGRRPGTRWSSSPSSWPPDAARSSGHERRC